MTVVNRVADASAPRQAAIDAALLVLGQMGLSPADLVAVPAYDAAVRRSLGVAASWDHPRAYGKSRPGHVRDSTPHPGLGVDRPA